MKLRGLIICVSSQAHLVQVQVTLHAAQHLVADHLAVAQRHQGAALGIEDLSPEVLER
jgi:hypothetical protein